jgi:hypothetical protein
VIHKLRKGSHFRTVTVRDCALHIEKRDGSAWNEGTQRFGSNDDRDRFLAGALRILRNEGFEEVE